MRLKLFDVWMFDHSMIKLIDFHTKKIYQRENFLTLIIKIYEYITAKMKSEDLMYLIYLVTSWPNFLYYNVLEYITISRWFVSSIPFILIQFLFIFIVVIEADFIVLVSLSQFPTQTLVSKFFINWISNTFWHITIIFDSWWHIK